MKPPGEKQIILCADDFGMNSAINDGILALADQGRLSATSCLVQGPDFNAGVSALKASGLQIGLHLNFTEAMGQAGLYAPVSVLIRQSYLRRLDSHQIKSQIRLQLDLFEKSVGKAPDFIDGHQHIHQFPQIRSQLLHELNQRYPDAKPYLRNTWPSRLYGVPLMQRFKAYTIGLLGARRFAAMARRQGYTMNPGFLGVYDFLGGQTTYQRLLQIWLNTARDGDIIMCHPAASVVRQDGLGLQRYAEFQVLNSTAIGSYLSQRAIKL